jgi:hypothetical protein
MSSPTLVSKAPRWNAALAVALRPVYQAPRARSPILAASTHHVAREYVVLKYLPADRLVEHPAAEAVAKQVASPVEAMVKH